MRNKILYSVVILPNSVKLFSYLFVRSTRFRYLKIPTLVIFGILNRQDILHRVVGTRHYTRRIEGDINMHVLWWLRCNRTYEFECSANSARAVRPI